MATSLKAKAHTGVTWDYSNPADLETPATSCKERNTQDFANGVGDGQADVCWSDERTLGATTSENIDLAGALTNNLTGGTITFAKIKAIRIVMKTTTDTFTLEIGGAATNGFNTPFGAAGDYFVLGNGGEFQVTNPNDGWAVTPTTGDLLKINNPNAASIDYEIYIVGTTS